jgi:hypothetical protein
MSYLLHCQHLHVDPLKEALQPGVSQHPGVKQVGHSLDSLAAAQLLIQGPAEARNAAVGMFCQYARTALKRCMEASLAAAQLLIQGPAVISGAGK